jgi:hypothetical protein
LVEGGRLDESPEVLQVRSISLDGFLFTASQECVEKTSGGARRVYGAV